MDEFVYDVYKGTLEAMIEKVCSYEDGTVRVFDLKRSMKPGKSHAGGCGCVGAGAGGDESALKNNSFDFLATEMKRDARENVEHSTHSHHVKWWVDVSYHTPVVSELTRAFGLDKRLEPSIYNHRLEETSPRILAGHDNVHLSGTDKNYTDASNHPGREGGMGHQWPSLMFLVQAQWIRNLPIIDLVSCIPFTWHTFVQHVAMYLLLRLPWLRQLAWTRDMGHVSIEQAKSIAEDLSHLESSADKAGSADSPADAMAGAGAGAGAAAAAAAMGVPLAAKSAAPTLSQSQQQALPNVDVAGRPLRDVNEGRPASATVLAGNSGLAVRPVTLETDMVSIHLLDTGSGISGLITYHQWQDELEEEQKLQCSMLPLRDSADYVDPHHKNPTATLAKELGRGKFACGGVVGRIFQGVRARLKFVVQHKGVTAEDSELADTSTALAALIIEKIHTFNEMSLGEVDRWLNQTEMEVQNFATRSHQSHLLNLRRLMGLMKNYVQPFEESIIRAAGDTSTTMGRFFKSDTRSDVWAPLWKGCHISNKRGSIAWRRHISKGLDRVEQCMQLYRSSLTCQYCSNLQYVTIFTILSCPCFYLTHYYGMNFDNMTALSSDMGVLHFWGFLALANAISFSILFHFRLFQ